MLKRLPGPSDAEAFHLQIESPPGESEDASSLRDVAARAIESLLDHLPFELLDGRRQRGAAVPFLN